VRLRKNLRMAARHHTVPQFYLRNFADASGKVRLVDRDDLARSHLNSVHNAAAEAGFYRIEAEDLAREEDQATFDPESIEAALSGLESAIAPAIRTLVEDRFADFGDDEWYRMVQFTALQTVRGRRWRNDLAALATQSARIHFLENLTNEKARSWLAEQGRPNGPDDVAATLAEFAASMFPRLVPPQAVLVQESLKMALGNPDTDDSGLGQYLAGKRLELIRPQHTSVLTSDEPVCWWSPGDSPVGYATAQIVWVPLSPRLIVQFREPEFDIAAHGLPDRRVRDTHEEIVNVVNRMVASQAERWIIHHPGDSPLADIALPPREIWGDELVAVDEDGETRRELYVHRRNRPAS
jgi:hypothetical protein